LSCRSCSISWLSSRQICPQRKKNLFQKHIMHVNFDHKIWGQRERIWHSKIHSCKLSWLLHIDLLTEKASPPVPSGGGTWPSGQRGVLACWRSQVPAPAVAVT
jgi:hypothetical protein